MLRKRNKVWCYQMRMGRRWVTWSTGETEKRKALEKVPELLRLAQLRNVPLAPSQYVEEAIVQEVDRLEQDISSMQAVRANSSLLAFRDWMGRNIPLREITTAMLLEFQRLRLKKVSRDTVRKDISFVMRMLKQNGHRIDKAPAPTTGRFNPNRAFTDEELEQLGPHIPEEYRTLYATLLATGARLAELVPSNKSSHIPLLKNCPLPTLMSERVSDVNTLSGAQRFRGTSR